MNILELSQALLVPGRSDGRVVVVVDSDLLSNCDGSQSQESHHEPIPDTPKLALIIKQHHPRDFKHRNKRKNKKSFVCHVVFHE